jgi:hypothetical protein
MVRPEGIGTTQLVHGQARCATDAGSRVNRGEGIACHHDRCARVAGPHHRMMERWHAPRREPLREVQVRMHLRRPVVAHQHQERLVEFTSLLQAFHRRTDRAVDELERLQYLG